MATLVPLNDASALQRFQDAGVEELYVGFHDAAWNERFGTAELNRMSGFGAEANPFSFGQMCEQIKHARSLGMDAFVCFNASSYTPQQHRFIAQSYLDQIARAGARGIIISNQALIEAGRAAGLDVVMSTVAGVFNEGMAAFYRNRGATRLILPRDLSSDEIAGIVHAVPQMEYEVFLMRNGCMFSDSHCLGCHRAGKPSLCRSLREGEWDVHPVFADCASEPYGFAQAGPSADGEFLEHARYTEWLLNTHYHRRTCGLCALWRFERLGIAAYKVVGRGDDVDDLVFDAGLVARNAELARNCATESEYLARMERPREPETLCDMGGLSCYYPELANV